MIIFNTEISMIVLQATESWCAHFDMNSTDMTKHKQSYIYK